MEPCPPADVLSGFVDGQLDDAQRQQLAVHLADCDVCGAAVAVAVDDGDDDTATRHIPGGAPIDQRSPPTSGSLVGRYSLQEQIGSGGIGVVFAAHDPRLGRRVALKLIRGIAAGAVDHRKRFVAEALALARVSHPNIVTVFDAGVDGDELFIAMALVEGMTLSRWIKASSERTWEEIRDVMVQAAQGLAAAHDAGLIHRDFKLSNALIGSNGRVQVVDFGLAKAVTGQDDPHTAGPPVAVHVPLTPDPLTLDGTTLGTPGYMSPEQIHGEELDARADQFAFAVALYSMLYEVRPFSGATLADVSAAIERGEPAPPGNKRVVPRWLHRAVLVGLSASPNDRHASMAVFIAALTPDHRRRRRITQLCLATVLAGSGGALAAWALIEPTPSVQQRTEIETLADASRTAAANGRWLFSPLANPEDPTAYLRVTQLEGLSGSAQPAATQRAKELRAEFSRTLMEFGDQYWEQPHGRAFALDYYAAALVFDPDHARAKQRAGVTAVVLADLSDRAKELEFDDAELAAGEIMRALSLPPKQRNAQLQALQQDDALAASVLTRLDALKSPLPVAVAPAKSTRPATDNGTDNADIDGPPSEPVALPDTTVAKTASSDKLHDAEVARGRAAYRRLELAAAEQHFHRALRAKPRSFDALSGLAKVAFQRGQPDNAISFAKRAAKRRPGDRSIRVFLGDIHYKLTEYDEARRHWQRARDAGSKDAGRKLEKLDRLLGG